MRLDDKGIFGNIDCYDRRFDIAWIYGNKARHNLEILGPEAGIEVSAIVRSGPEHLGAGFVRVFCPRGRPDDAGADCDGSEFAGRSRP